jgi:hypothetical protein
MASYPGAIKTWVDRTDDVHDVMADDVNTGYSEMTAIETELGVDVAGTASNLVTRLARSLSGAGNLDFASATTLTIATGSITPTQNWHLIETQAAAATDDLDTIVATNATDGFILYVRQVDDARCFTIRNDIGNILTPSGLNVATTNAQQVITFVYDGTTSKWMLVTEMVSVASETGGWLTAAETWTPQSSTDTTGVQFEYIASSIVDDVYSPGMRVRYTDVTTKYGIITAVSGSQVTLFASTDYAMSGSAITNPCYSSAKAPFGFPLDPDKWTLGWFDDNTRTQTNPVNEQRYNLGSLHLDIPIGAWNIWFGAQTLSMTSGSTGAAWYVSNVYFDSSFGNFGALSLTVPSQSTAGTASIERTALLTLTTATEYTHYLYYEGDACDSIGTYGAYIYATSAYL